MEADTRLSDNSAATSKGAKSKSKGAYSASAPCGHFPKGARERGDKVVEPVMSASHICKNSARKKM